MVVVFIFASTNESTVTARSLCCIFGPCKKKGGVVDILFYEVSILLSHYRITKFYLEEQYTQTTTRCAHYFSSSNNTLYMLSSIIALTMSPSFALSALMASARDTCVWDTTNSISRSLTPAASTCSSFLSLSEVCS